MAISNYIFFGFLNLVQHKFSFDGPLLTVC